MFVEIGLAAVDKVIRIGSKFGRDIYENINKRNLDGRAAAQTNNFHTQPSRKTD